MFVFDSFLYFRCEDHARAGPGVTRGARFGSLDHTRAGLELTRGHGFAPWTILWRGLA